MTDALVHKTADAGSLGPAAADRPSGLRPVLAVIPAHCYERSMLRGLSLFARDLALYVVSVGVLLMTNHPLMLAAGWLLAGLSATGLFVLGHDAAHQALFDSPRLNGLIARVAMLPSLHATALWIHGHNRVHHGHTLKQGVDFVWHPLTGQQFSELGRLRRLQHRFEWGPLGAGAYYLRCVWWNKMMRFSPPKRWARAMRRDRAMVTAYALAPLVTAVALSGTAGVWIWVKVVVVPFMIFCQVIGWAVHVHHIQPDIRWWPRHDWNRFRGQVEGTTVLIGPPGWNVFFHWIMIHLPHHVDMRIPCYRLAEAADAIAAKFPHDVDEQRISVRAYLDAVQECKLHDFETGTWHRYPT